MALSVLITGGADGIGLGIAQSFLQSGSRVHVCDNRAEAVERVKNHHPLLSASEADVSDPGQAEALIATAKNEMGHVDVLINNVGIAGPHAPVEDQPVEQWDHTLKVNLSGAFYCIKHTVRDMKARKSGVVLNISSVGTFTMPPNRTVYNASKWGIEGLTKSLARELGPFSIRCNAILPGVMNNKRMHGIMERRSRAENRSIEDIQNEYIRYVPMGSFIEVEEIGDLAVFLASSKAKHVTGQLIAVDGGILFEL